MIEFLGLSTKYLFLRICQNPDPNADHRPLPIHVDLKCLLSCNFSPFSRRKLFCFPYSGFCRPVLNSVIF